MRFAVDHQCADIPLGLFLMINMLESLRNNPSLVDGFLFVLIILSAVMAFFLAQAGSTIGLGLILAILVLANLLVILI